MATTYTWNIDMMHTASKAGLADAVTVIHWSKTGTNENGIAGRYPGVTRYNVSAIDSSGFTPLNQLTEEQVIEWVKSDLSEEQKTFIDVQILSSIQHQLAEVSTGCVTSDKMPWTSTT